MSIQEQTKATFEQLKKRLLPAVLKETSYVNGAILGTWAKENGIDSSTITADQLYRGVCQKADKLEWDVLPKSLQRQEVRNQNTAKHDQDAFAAKLKQADAAAEYAKTQEAALRQIESLISSIQLKDSSGNRISYAKTEAVQKACRAHLAKAIAGKRNLVDVARELSNYRDEEYTKAEKATERMAGVERM
jgi:hypothetical protein